MINFSNNSYSDDYEEYDIDSFTIPPRTCPTKLGQVSITDWVAIFQCSFTFVFGVPGNGLVLWITAFEMKRSVNTIWFQNLAVADLLCCLSAPFSIMTIFLGYWPLGLFACKFLPFILLLNMYASVLLLTMISIDRCVLVMKPVWCQNNRSLRRAYAACVLMWILATILSSPVLIFRNIRECNGIETCSYDYRILRHHRQMVEDLIALCRVQLGFVIPFLVIVVCYTMLTHRVKSRFTHNTKTMKVTIVVIIGFFVCWLPYHVSGTILAMNVVSSPLFKSTFGLHNIFMALAFMNSCINPIIYVLMGKDFKSKLKRSLKVILKNVLEEQIMRSDSTKTHLSSETKSTETPI
ncbi:hypothetical protein GDO78_013242 [Eleutherodactylus coqui]|uniref:C5a anaphylatoxin chemotactic receptor 1 n=1 Tax=Eleutherodactylus coqui TaxID=57060 RepID=A0A8J6F046_ELECQ|nr:hypothetical protein GDO78_013242 [Eleutherodactylus coqui]